MPVSGRSSVASPSATPAPTPQPRRCSQPPSSDSASHGVTSSPTASHSSGKLTSSNPAPAAAKRPRPRAMPYSASALRPMLAPLITLPSRGRSGSRRLPAASSPAYSGDTPALSVLCPTLYASPRPAARFRATR